MTTRPFNNDVDATTAVPESHSKRPLHQIHAKCFVGYMQIISNYLYFRLNVKVTCLIW